MGEGGGGGRGECLSACHSVLLTTSTRHHCLKAPYLPFLCPYTMLHLLTQEACHLYHLPPPTVLPTFTSPSCGHSRFVRPVPTDHLVLPLLWACSVYIVAVSPLWFIPPSHAIPLVGGHAFLTLHALALFVTGCYFSLPPARTCHNSHA